MRIDGKFEGRVNTSDTLVVGETGDLQADIEAGTVICRGKMRGTIVASKKVELHPSSKIVGNVQTPALSIELGAILDGNCNMTGSNKIVDLMKEEKK